MDDLKDRLAAALRSINIDPDNNDQVRKLAAKIGVTYQGMRKLIAGESREMMAKTNAKAANALGVDAHWLATGEGEMHSDRVWPFPHLTQQQWRSVSKELREAAENMLTASVRAPATGPPPPGRPSTVVSIPQAGEIGLVRTAAQKRARAARKSKRK